MVEPILDNWLEELDESETPTLTTADEIETWLAAKLAERLSVDPTEIDTQVPFESYALESADALILLDHLETELGCTLSPTILWNYPTIAALSHHLSTQTLTY
ncbi:acyl carrier protein [Leptolyngbya sp. 7M]|uniref:acyl carrier protein n=1 Tax=Leptolyngbya sp. 7M TaxID=2812896 RepID=UPI001B8BF86C|nr:acyl carrier protein [Leptolyngbya sp. 7M]QYO63697.1 acyl carrier protein [Leptolyngbya sp. 7M]